MGKITPVESITILEWELLVCWWVVFSLMGPELSTAQILTEANSAVKKSHVSMHSPALFTGWERNCLCLWPKADLGKDVPTEICMLLLFSEGIYT